MNSTDIILQGHYNGPYTRYIVLTSISVHYGLKFVQIKLHSFVNAREVNFFVS